MNVFEAVSQDNIRFFEQLISSNPTLVDNFDPDTGNSLCGTTILKGNLAALKILKKYGAKLDYHLQYTNKLSIWHFIAGSPNPKFKTYVEATLNVSIVSQANLSPSEGPNKGMTVLWVALRYKQYNLAREILQKCDSIDANLAPEQGAYKGMTILWVALQGEQYDLAREILQKCDSIDANLSPKQAPYKGVTILWAALQHKQYSLAAEIIKKCDSIDANLGPEEGPYEKENILWTALKHHQCDLARVIVKKSGPIDANLLPKEDPYEEDPHKGQTALWLALGLQKYDLARDIIEKSGFLDANLTPKQGPHKGKTILLWALINNHYDIVPAIVQKCDQDYHTLLEKIAIEKTSNYTSEQMLLLAFAFFNFHIKKNDSSFIRQTWNIYKIEDPTSNKRFAEKWKLILSWVENNSLIYELSGQPNEIYLPYLYQSLEKDLGTKLPGYSLELGGLFSFCQNFNTLNKIKKIVLICEYQLRHKHSAQAVFTDLTIADALSRYEVLFEEIIKGLNFDPLKNNFDTLREKVHLFCSVKEDFFSWYKKQSLVSLSQNVVRDKVASMTNSLLELHVLETTGTTSIKTVEETSETLIHTYMYYRNGSKVYQGYEPDRKINFIRDNSTQKLLAKIKGLGYQEGQEEMDWHLISTLSAENIFFQISSEEDYLELSTLNLEQQEDLVKKLSLSSFEQDFPSANKKEIRCVDILTGIGDTIYFEKIRGLDLYFA